MLPLMNKSFLVLFFKKERLAFLAALVVSACQTAQPGTCKMGHVTDLALTFAHGHLVTPALLNDAPMNLIVDTGAQGTTLTEDATSRIGIYTSSTNAYVSGVGGSRSLSLFYAKTFRLGTMHGEHLGLTASPFDFPKSNPRIDGLLGADFLSHYDLDFDLGEKKLQIFKVLEGCTNPSVALEEPMFMAPLAAAYSQYDARPHVRIEIGGKTLRAVVDSGAQNTVIFRGAARRLGLSLDDLKADPHFRSTGVGPHARDSALHKMAPITIGEVTISNLPVAIVDDRLDDGTDMLLGLDFFARVHVWLSFSSHTMVMQYPPKNSP